MAENVANQIARQLFAMASKRRDKDLVQSLQNERYQRTFTDELFQQNSRAGLQPVEEEQRRQWEMLAGRNER